MAQLTCFFLCLCLHVFALSVCSSSSGSFQDVTSLEEQAQQEQEQKLILSHRQLFTNFQQKNVRHDEIYPPVTTFPTPPVNVLPTTFPPPSAVSVPSTNPVVLTPNPDTMPVPTVNPVDSPLPITNPVTTPSTTTPVTNPVTTYPSPTTGVPATTPVTNPPATASSGAVQGQSWCVVKSGVSESTIQAALDYACGIGGADCSPIQVGASCYNPNSLQNHASYAFNSYYHKNPVQTSCDFGGSGFITTTNPSTGTCVYPTSSSQTSAPQTATTTSPTTTPPPTTTSPTTTSPTTTSPITTSPTIPSPMSTSSGGGAIPGFDAPPSLLSPSNPATIDGTSGFGETPPSFNSSISISVRLQPFIGFIILATSTVVGRFTLDM